MRLDSVTTMSSSSFFSRPSSWAFLGSFQTEGSSSEALTVLRRSDLASKSKIPPEGLGPCAQVGEPRADLVDAFCFHFAKDPEKGRIFARGTALPQGYCLKAPRRAWAPRLPMVAARSSQRTAWVASRGTVLPSR